MPTLDTSGGGVQAERTPKTVELELIDAFDSVRVLPIVLYQVDVVRCRQ